MGRRVGRPCRFRRNILTTCSGSRIFDSLARVGLALGVDVRQTGVGGRLGHGARIRVSRRGVVVVLADQATLDEMVRLDGAGRGHRQGARPVVRYVRVESLSDLGQRLTSMGDEVTAVVLDPILAAPDERAALTAARQLARADEDVRVTLYAPHTPAAMHAVLRLGARCARCELVVQGLDELPAWSRLAPAGGQMRDEHRLALQQVMRLPQRIRVAWLDALSGEAEPTVKRVAAFAGVKRRSLERAHRTCDVVSPGRLLRELRSEEAWPVRASERGIQN